MNALAGKHALVTGGGSGIGAAIARALAEAGAVVTICGRRAEPLDNLAGEHPGIHPQVCDVCDEKAIERLFTSASAAHGPIDIIVANAGAADSAPLHKTDLALWDRMMSVNLRGAFLTLREGLRHIKAGNNKNKSTPPWGRLICVASNAGLRGYRYVSAYSAAKHGVVGLVRSAALEVADTSITVNAICPGFTDTPLLDRSVDNIVSQTGTDRDKARASMERMNPGGRLVQPAEVAAAVLWLTGDDSDSINGQAIELSGGNA